MTSLSLQNKHFWHHVMWYFLAKQRVFTLGDGCWLPMSHYFQGVRSFRNFETSFEKLGTNCGNQGFTMILNQIPPKFLPTSKFSGPASPKTLPFCFFCLLYGVRLRSVLLLFPDPPTLAFLDEKQGKPRKKARVFLFAEPLKSLEKEGKAHKKGKESRKTQKARKSKKARIGGSGLFFVRSPTP